MRRERDHRGRGKGHSLNLAYDPALSAETLRELEFHARNLGLSLETLERIGQDERLCEAFLREARRGAARRFLLALEIGGAAEATTPHELPVVHPRARGLAN